MFHNDPEYVFKPSHTITKVSIEMEQTGPDSPL